MPKHLLELLIAGVTLVVGLCLFLSGVEAGRVPPEMQAVMGSSPSRIWVGNSVAQRAVDPDQLPAGEVRLALDGAELAHWVAALERLDLQGAQVVIYASVRHLGVLELEATRDRELFWALAPADGGRARPWAVGQPPWVGPLMLERGHRRDRALQGAAGGVAGMLWGAGGPDLLREGQGEGPVVAGTLPGRGERGRAVPLVLPTGPVRDLIQAAGGSLTWVLPYEREPGPCEVAPVVAALAAEPGVRVIDLSAFALPPSWFGSEMHLTSQAQPWVSRELRRQVDAAPPGLTKVCGE